MGTKRYDAEKARKLLRYAYDGREDTMTDGNWRSRTMIRIRQERVPEPKDRYFYALERFVWRAAPVTFTLSLVLGLFLVRAYVVARPDGLQLFMNCTEELVMATIFGA